VTVALALPAAGGTLEPGWLNTGAGFDGGGGPTGGVRNIGAGRVGGGGPCGCGLGGGAGRVDCVGDVGDGAEGDGGTDGVDEDDAEEGRAVGEVSVAGEEGVVVSSSVLERFVGFGGGGGSGLLIGG